LTRKSRERRARPQRTEPSIHDRARDELFSAIRQCGVIEASEAEQLEWMAETVSFMGERYPDLTPQDLEQLKHTGLRFCQPVIPHGPQGIVVESEEANAA
jgi:hypothetical protein